MPSPRMFSVKVYSAIAVLNLRAYSLVCTDTAAPYRASKCLQCIVRGVAAAPLPS